MLGRDKKRTKSKYLQVNGLPGVVKNAADRFEIQKMERALPTQNTSKNVKIAKNECYVIALSWHTIGYF